MDTLQIIILALIQGLTEFLPVSSSAHLILPSQLLGWRDQGLAFDVAVHVGTLVAVVVYFRVDIIKLVLAWFKQFKTRSITPDARLAWYVILATIPACLFGLFFNDVIEEHFRSTHVIAATTIIFGILLGFADRFSSRSLSLYEMTLYGALIIGVSQAVAMIPGTSRSGITITMALFLGFSRESAARFSFLLSIPIIILSGLYMSFKAIGADDFLWADIVLGALCAGFSAYFCIHFFLKLINRLSMLPFVIYRLILGGVLIAMIGQFF